MTSAREKKVECVIVLTNTFGNCRMKSFGSCRRCFFKDITERLPVKKESGMEENMKRLPESEREIMMIIWQAGKPVTRGEIESRLGKERKLSPTTILSFLSRLEEKGFVAVCKEGKNNVYTALVGEKEYLQKESRSILSRFYRNSLTDFVSALSDGGNLTEQDVEELQEFLDRRRKDMEDTDK